MNKIFESHLAESNKSKLKYCIKSLTSSTLSLNSKLTIVYDNFKEKLKRNYYITLKEQKFLLFFLRFMFDFNMKDEEFTEIDEHHQKYFIKFITNRFFKDNINKSNDYYNFYHDISVNTDDFSTFSNIDNHKSNVSVSLKQIDQKDSMSLSHFPKPRRRITISKSWFNNDSNSSLRNVQTSKLVKKPIPEKSVQSVKVRGKKCVKIKILDSRKKIVNSIDPKYFPKYSSVKQMNIPGKKQMIFKMPSITKQSLLENKFKLSRLQDYLRKKEKLNLICRRKKTMHQKTKRNDEKTKKIFKKTIKYLMSEFKRKTFSEM
jgi:hypothetical protein